MISLLFVEGVVHQAFPNNLNLLWFQNRRTRTYKELEEIQSKLHLLVVRVLINFIGNKVVQEFSVAIVLLLLLLVLIWLFKRSLSKSLIRYYLRLLLNLSLNLRFIFSLRLELRILLSLTIKVTIASAALRSKDKLLVALFLKPFIPCLTLSNIQTKVACSIVSNYLIFTVALSFLRHHHFELFFHSASWRNKERSG